MEYDQRQEFRTNRAMKKFFLDLGEESSSEFIRNQVEKGIIERRDPEYLNYLIKQKKDEIKQIEEMLSSPHILMDQFNKLLSKHAPGYKKNAPFRTEAQLRRFVEDIIFKEAKKCGVKKTFEEIHEILMNFPEKNNENGGEIKEKENGKNV